MCGISGYLDTTDGVSTQVLERMNSVIRHRGPDDEGYALISPTACVPYGGTDTLPALGLPPLSAADGSRAFLGLGHRRLSILDVSEKGHQPMSTPESHLTVVYNGEIYNYLELRRELESLGYEFRTACDTEVLLRAYEAWGEDCLTRFNGMWSFALWDAGRRRLFCARDRLGAKPFHYWHAGGKLLFGSELKQLCQDERIPRRINRPYLAANLLYRLSDHNDQTLIEGMRALPPGHKLTVQLSPDCGEILALRAEPYWQLDTSRNDSLTPTQWREQLAEEFSRACRWRLRSDAPLAALLSGGLDSSCMVAELCRQLGDPARLETFTTSYPGRADCDEWRYADLVTRACGCRGNRILPDPAEGIEARFDRLIWHIEGTGNLTLLGVQVLQEELHRRNFKVVLNGQCGDELFFGYLRFYAFFLRSLLRQGRGGEFLREYRLAAKHSRLSAGEVAQSLAYFNLPALREGRQLHRTRPFVRRELLEQRDGAELRRLLYPKTLEQMQHAELTATNLPLIVRHDDRLYMSASLESRIPFMDYRLVELAARMPPELKIRNGWTKHILRELFQDRLPEEVVWRTDKVGFAAPSDRFAAAFSRDYLAETITNAKTADYFHTDYLLKRLETAPTDPAIFDFLQIERFARQFGVS